MRALKETFETGTKITTVRADFTGVEGIDFLHGNAFHCSFIGNKLLQLREAPALQPEVHPFSSSLLSDSLEVFHHNSSSWLYVVNDFFADIVVDPGH